jgi:hypothetical protein
MRVVEVVPERLKEARAVGLKEFGVDLADAEAVRKFKASSIAEWQIVSWLASYYQIYSVFWRLVVQYAADQNLTGVRSAQVVCDAYIEATERHLYTIALDFDELRKELPQEKFPTEELSKVLSAIVATRISLHRNQRLRVAIDELREHSEDKSAKRERFEQLLNELQGQVLEIWAETEHPLGSLSEIRTESARRLEKRDSQPPAEQELAGFVSREELLKQGRDAGLPPQEFELYKLLITEPGLKYREYGARLGISASHVGVLKTRIKNTPRAAG